jgi:hypothetical protein
VFLLAAPITALAAAAAAKYAAILNEFASSRVGGVALVMTVGPQPDRLLRARGIPSLKNKSASCLT